MKNWLKKWLLSLLVVFSAITLVNPIFAKEKASDWNGDANTPYEIVNNNVPYFTEADKKNTNEFEIYGNLDSLGRCTACFVNVSPKTLPKDDREPSLGSVEPSGWRTNGKSNNNKYSFVSGNYVYNRCHLIGYQHTGQNANPKNLITGTRYLNVIGMLPFENDVAKYVKKTGNHCLYRVTPIFTGSNLVAEGVRMEAYSVEDKGKGICFNVFCYNVQPNVEINYATGQNWVKEDGQIETYSDPFYDKTKQEVLETTKAKSNVIYSGNTKPEEEYDTPVKSSSNKNTSSKSSNDKPNYLFLIIIAILLFMFMNKNKGSGGRKSGGSSGARKVIKRYRR